MISKFGLLGSLDSSSAVAFRVCRPIPSLGVLVMAWRCPPFFTNLMASSTKGSSLSRKVESRAVIERMEALCSGLWRNDATAL